MRSEADELKNLAANLHQPLTASFARRRIFETIYHAALEASCELAEAEGTYESYEGEELITPRRPPTCLSSHRRDYQSTSYAESL